MGLKLIDLCKSYDLQILNGRTIGDPHGYFTFHDTQQGASAIDVAVLSDPIVKRVKSFSVNNPDDYSQHCKIVLRLDNMLILPTTEKPDEYKWIDLDTKYSWKEDSEEKFKNALNSVPVKKIARECQQYLEAGLIEPAASKIEEMFVEAANQSLETKTNKTKTSDQFKHKKKWKKWFDHECREQKNKTRRLAIQKHQHSEDKTLRTRHNEELKKYKTLCSKKKFEFEQQQAEKLAALADDNIEFWKYWKHYGDSIKPDKDSNADGKKWEDYFRNLFDDTNQNENNNFDVDGPGPLDTKFSLEELEHTLKKLKCKKATKGKILIEFLKAAPKDTKKLILRMINTVYSSGIVPNSWCLGIITAIHKEGPKDNPDNYRGICIGDALAKTMCTMMNERLTQHVKDNNIIDKAQIGFTAKNRTPDHILAVKSVVNKYVTDSKNGSKLYTCFIDFRKAFDTVWHHGLYQKLEEANIKGKFLKTLINMYTKTKCAVRMGNKTTQYFSCKKGVRQGDPLSPLLFNLYINGIFQQLASNNCDPVTLDGEKQFSALAYADDIVLISTTKEGLQKALDITQKYCEDWKLQVNHKKTKCMTFTKGTQKEKHIFTINGQALENVKDFKYLGIMIKQKGLYIYTSHQGTWH